MKEHSFGRVYSQSLKYLRVLEGEFYHLPNPLQFFPQAANIFVGYFETTGFSLGLVSNLNLGAGMYQQYPFRDGANNREILAARAKEVGSNCIPFHQR